jgi:hypothetical protein
MSLPSLSNGRKPPYRAPLVQPTLPLQQPALPSFDLAQSSPRDTHFNNPLHSDLFNPFATADSNVQQNANPFLAGGQLPLDLFWPLMIRPQSNPAFQHASTSQNVQATGTRPTSATHPAVGSFQFGSGQSAPSAQDTTTSAPLTAAPSSSSSCVDPAGPSHARPPASDAPLFHPGAADAGPSTSTQSAHARKPKRSRAPPGRNARRGRAVPLVRIEDHIEWVSPDVMKMTVWFNWSPDAEAEAHDAWG